MILQKTEALRRLQLKELEILKAVSSFCRTEGIVWFLDSGTVLGAKRHGGFIPWDDDIDIGMLREDFDRFLFLARESGRFPEGFSVHTISNTHGFGGMYAKVFMDGTVFQTTETKDAFFEQGIFIDVFPYDRLYRDEKKRKWQIKNARLWQSLLFLAQSGEVRVPHSGALGMAERIACKAAHPLVSTFLNQERMVAGYRKSIPSSAADTIDVFAPLPYPLFHNKDTLVPPILLEFEGCNYPCPADPDNYLEVKYGDWNKMPAVEDRKTHMPLFLDFGDGDYYEADSPEILP